MVATVENRTKAMTEMLEAKKPETVVSPSSNPHFFYTETQKRPRACFHSRQPEPVPNGTRDQGGFLSIELHRVARIIGPCGDHERNG